jgi:hypothetical protein
LGSYYGSWIKSGKNLTGIHLDKGRRLASKYVGQLVSIANGGSHP